MTTDTLTPVRVDHWIELSAHNTPRLAANKETVLLRFLTTWQKRDVNVRMQAERYTDSEGRWTEWRIYADEAREGTAIMEHTPELTGLARGKLGTQFRPTVEAWLNGPEVDASRAAAYVAAVEGFAGRMDRYGTPPSQDLRHALAINAAFIPAAANDRLTRAANAFDLFVSLLKESA